MKTWTPETIAEARAQQSFERTGWRDAELSRRHHFYGFDCPMVDIDFLVTEYCYARPKAIVEYKNERAKPPDFDHPSYRALTCLADLARIPFFVCIYATDFSWWQAIPRNDRAFEFLGCTTNMSEKRWVELLYILRGLSMPQDVRTRFDRPPTL